MFYRNRNIFTRYYLLPIYIIPVSIGLYGRIHVVNLFLILASAVMFLSTFWSVRIHIFMCLKRSNFPEYVYYQGQVCKIENYTFYLNRQKFFIENSKIHKVSVDIAKSFELFRDMRSIVPMRIYKKLDQNKFNIEPPSFFRLLSEHMVSPFFVFQIFCSILWCLDEYIYHSMITIVMLVLFEVGMVYQRISTMKEFKQMNLRSIDVKLIKRSLPSPDVVEQKETSHRGQSSPKEEISKEDLSRRVNSLSSKSEGLILKSSELMPGDVIEITNPGIQIPCDMLLLKGRCAVNEAMLSGESIPFTKEDIRERNPKDILNYNSDKKHILFGGTELVKVSNIICYVLKTGFDTEQGELIRKMMCTKNTVTANNFEAFLFIVFLLFFAILASVYSYINSVKLGKSSYKILLEIILILTNVVPPELPMELTIAVNNSLQSLMKLGIFCLEPFRIPISGKVDVCCFDKTGTLTESFLNVYGIIKSGDISEQISIVDETQPITDDNNFISSDSIIIPPSKPVDDLSDILDTEIEKKILKVVGTCHSLVKISDSIEGDSLETSVFSFKNMSLINDDTVQCNLGLLKTIKRYSFSSDLKRMTCIGQFNSEKFVSMKGAPEVVKNYLSEIPKNYDVFETFAKKGFRIIALAYKDLDTISQSRSDLENSLEFLGFVLYECRLKADALETVKTLMDSGHKVVMITGDNLFTAKCVAKQLGIPGCSIEGEDIEAIVAKDDSIFKNDPKCSSNHLDDCGFSRIGVFARASPKHKEIVIEQYKSRGLITLMCGDGTNDIGALKSAHIGVAVVDTAFDTNMNAKDEVKIKLGDASVAAPFTAKNGKISSVLNIIRQGRSTLVTTVQMYKILSLNSLITAFSLSVLDSFGVRFSDGQLTASGILLAFSFMFLTNSKPLNHISKKKPLSNIFNPYIILSVISQTSVHIGTYYFLIGKVSKIEHVEYSEKFKPSLVNSVLFLISSYQQTSTFIVNYIGRPFRESITENKPLFLCIMGLCFFIGSLIFQFNKEFVDSMEIVIFDNEVILMILSAISCNFICCWILEKVLFNMFMV